MHKGFKCLEPKEGRVYISRDVVFDEHVFSFASLHPNAGARLRSELALLPDVLKNSSSEFGNAKLCDQHLFSPASTNRLSSQEYFFGNTGADRDGNTEATSGNRGVRGHYRLCRVPGDSTPMEGDPLPLSANASGSGRYPVG
jgi:hypothetical protein